VIADSKLLTNNELDGEIYAFGRGPSATSVSAPNTAIPKGTPVLIQGTVTDQSPGQTHIGVPLKGTPAISDDSMSEWMQYMFLSQPKPTDAKGVPVKLTVTYPDGTTEVIGTTTSDITGYYAFAWTPQTPGLYKVTATFEGSGSYYSSMDNTAFVVSETTTTFASPEASSSSSENAMPLTSIYIGVAVVVVIVAIAAIVVYLRKRK
jgi:hypothetical protein